MRSLLSALLIFLQLLAGAQTPGDTSRKLCITPQGAAFGKISSASIGKEGGRLVSDDGKLELVFPKGALENNTTISIQAQTSTMPSGVGISYGLEPSGTAFKQPVKAILHYSDEELKETKELLSLALQNSSGQWSAVKDVSFDTVGKTATGYINHFSSLVVYQKAQLVPKSKTVKVKDKAFFHITMFTTVQDIDYADIWEIEYRLVLYEDGYFDTKEEPLWRVNGKKNGDAVSGTIQPGQQGTAYYHAPAIVPSVNPVTVSVEMQMAYVKRPVKIILTSSVYIVDNGYHFTFISISQNPGGVFQQIDSSTCDIVIEKDKVRLENIINHPPWSDWPARTKSGNALSYPDRNGWKGHVEIAGMSKGTVIPATDINPFTSIMISLVPTMGNTPAIIEKGPGGTRSIPTIPFPAQPTYIKFDTDGNDINIEYMGIKGKNEIKKIKNGEGFIIKAFKL